MKSNLVFGLENAGWPALLVDSGSTILCANQPAIKIFGPALERASPLLSAIWSSENGTSPEQFLVQWERSPSPTIPLRFRARDGSTAAYSTSLCSCTKDGQKFFIFQLLADTTPTGEEKGPPADAALAQKQKLDCALQMARTVALDFNNALTSILGHASLLLSRAEPDHPWRRSLIEVEKSAARAAEIANDLAAFSRQEKEARGQAAGNLNTILQHCVEVFKQSRTGQITWKRQLERRLFVARFDEAKIQQAVMNVLENAVEALKDDGRITLQTRNVELMEPTQDRQARLAPGSYVCAEISDDGRGIEADVLPRIFDPFFTTKRGAHRGLGLAWVYGIVTNHGGGVAVSSQPGTGTSVRIYLPASKNVVQEQAGSADGLGGHETILMVDDEDLLLTMGETILSSYGYSVLTANSGQKALEIISKGTPSIDLVITDLVMPAMSGRELVEHIRQISPATLIMCTSGYVWPASKQEDTTYLQKPFTSQELLMKVKHVLSAKLSPVD